MAHSPAIQINNLTKSYGDKHVLTGLNLDVPTGTVLALLGPNGAGKTTTVEILQGLRRPGSGTVSVLGQDPQSGSRAWRARIGVVSQSSKDMEKLTVTEAITHVARFYSSPADVAATIEQEDLSADGTTVLLTTHYLDEAAHLADDVAIVLGGKIVTRGTPEDLTRQAGNERTVSWIEGGVRRSEQAAAPTAVVRDLINRLAGPDGEVPGLEVTNPSLEDFYLNLVSRHHAA